MRNPIFKAQVTDLFEKVAFGYDPRAVAEAAPDIAPKINRGLALERGFNGAAAASDQLLRGAGSMAEKALTGGSGMATKALSGVSSFVQKHPTAAIGTAVMAPILSGAFSQSQNRNQEELMNAYHDPNRVITASLDEFLEKKAAFGGGGSVSFGGELAKSFAGGIGGALAGTIAQIVGSHLMNSKSLVADDPRRKSLLENLFTTDPVIKDSLARHPDNKTLLLEAYGTMCKFAPTLSMDINAVRSILREAVLGGSGLNYATVKNLVDTEKSIAEAKPRFGGKR